MLPPTTASLVCSVAPSVEILFRRTIAATAKVDFAIKGGESAGMDPFDLLQ